METEPQNYLPLKLFPLNWLKLFLHKIGMDSPKLLSPKLIEIFWEKFPMN
jgi:hypothetical protein